MRHLCTLILFLLVLSLPSCLEKNEPAAAPNQGTKPIIKGARKINFIIDGAYDLSRTKAHSTLDSVSMSGSDAGLFVPADYPSAAFFLDNTSGKILAVVKTDTLSEKVLVNAESVAEALLTLVPAYHSLTLKQQRVFEREVKSTRTYQDFVSQVDALLKSKKPIHSTDAAYIGKLLELNSYVLKAYLGDPVLINGKGMRRVVKQSKDWLVQAGGGSLDNQVHSYVYAEFIPRGGGSKVTTFLDPQPIPVGQYSKKPLSAVVGLKDDYYTVNLNQTHPTAVSKNYYELSTRLAKMFLNAFLGRLGQESRNDCVAAIAGAIQVEITATMLQLAGGASIPAKDVLGKISAVAGTAIQTAFTNSACQKTLLNKSVIAKALAAQTNVFVTVIERAAQVYELVEYAPFILAQTDPVVMSDKMQVYKGKLVPGWVEFKGLAGSVEPEYVVSSVARPVVEAKVASSFDKVDLGQFEATWIVTSGNGEVSPAKNPFNSDGKAVTSWKLPAVAGTYSMRADLLDGEREDMQPPIRFQTKATDCDPAKPQNPVITGYTLSCGGSGIFIDVSFKAEGPGILVTSGSGSCDPKLLCYPVRLSFMRQGIEPDWVIAANGYSASLLSGTVNDGVVRINFRHFFGTCFPNMTPREFLEAGYPKYMWQVQLMNKCNQRSSPITF